jgi:hypothetical protein
MSSETDFSVSAAFKLGLLHFDYATLHPDSEPDDIRISVYTPADARTRAAVARLARRA